MESIMDMGQKLLQPFYPLNYNNRCSVCCDSKVRKTNPCLLCGECDISKRVVMNHTFEDLTFLQDSRSNLDLHEEDGTCKLFYGSFGPLFHAGNLCLGQASFLTISRAFTKLLIF